MLAVAKAGTPGRSSAATKQTPPSKPSSTTRTTARPAGILKVAPVSPALRKFLGVPEVSRTDAVKTIWEYIKLHNLQIDRTIIVLEFGQKGSTDGEVPLGTR